MPLFALLCHAGPLAPSEALERYLNAPQSRPPECSGEVFEMQIDASLPKLGKHGHMDGLRAVSRTGEVLYRGVRFTGDSLVKTHVIARFLGFDQTRASQTEGALDRRSYSFVYVRTSDYNGLDAYVFRLRPRHRRAGLFQGELWLDANAGAPLRLWGDLVKSPSVFVRSLRFVQDYQQVHQCEEPLRLQLSVRTRIAGAAELEMWLHAIEDAAAARVTADDAAQ